MLGDLDGVRLGESDGVLDGFDVEKGGVLYLAVTGATDGVAVADATGEAVVQSSMGPPKSPVALL